MPSDKRKLPSTNLLRRVRARRDSSEELESVSDTSVVHELEGDTVKDTELRTEPQLTEDSAIVWQRAKMRSSEILTFDNRQMDIIQKTQSWRQ